MPTFDKIAVNRFPYMSIPGDTNDVKEIKEFITIILDKIEDTKSQIETKDVF